MEHKCLKCKGELEDLDLFYSCPKCQCLWSEEYLMEQNEKR